MKITKALILIALSWSIGSCADQQVNVQEEKQAIQATIEKFLTTNDALDIESWSSNFVQDPETFLSVAGSDGHYHAKNWDELYQHAVESFGASAERPDSVNAVRRQVASNFVTKVYGASAYTTFNLKWIVEKGEDIVVEDESFETYGMEKQNGVWKIAFISAVKLASYEAAE